MLSIKQLLIGNIIYTSVNKKLSKKKACKWQTFIMLERNYLRMSFQRLKIQQTDRYQHQQLLIL